MRVKMPKPSPPAPTASATGPCPTVIKIEGRPGTGSLPSTIAPPDHPAEKAEGETKVCCQTGYHRCRCNKHNNCSYPVTNVLNAEGGA